MRFLDAHLYSDTEACLRFLRELPARGTSNGPRERVHFFWHGRFALKQAVALKSFFATQSPEAFEPWLWLDEDGHTGHETNPFLTPFLKQLRIERVDATALSRGTPLESRPDLYTAVNSTTQSNFVRFLALYHHGGIYVDMDTMFLRDWRPLLDDPRFGREFCYRWSAHMPYATSAIIRLVAGGPTVRALLETCRAVGSCRPRFTMRFDQHPQLDLTVLPCVFFDPLWPHVDRQDKYREAPFKKFPDFFRRFGLFFRKKKSIVSYRDFFPGAFAYQWHNRWADDEHADSYFGLFNAELDQTSGRYHPTSIRFPAGSKQ